MKASQCCGTQKCIEYRLRGVASLEIQNCWNLVSGDDGKTLRERKVLWGVERSTSESATPRSRPALALEIKKILAAF